MPYSTMAELGRKRIKTKDNCKQHKPSPKPSQTPHLRRGEGLLLRYSKEGGRCRHACDEVAVVVERRHEGGRRSRRASPRGGRMLSSRVSERGRKLLSSCVMTRGRHRAEEGGCRHVDVVVLATPGRGVSLDRWGEGRGGISLQLEHVRKKLQNSEWPKSASVINDIDVDGYILSLQRLPAGRSGKKATKPPVLFNTDAICWLLNTPGESLGFILADNEYDVWIANARGTKYSRGHKSLRPNDAAYWDWSWDELASYDLPAFVKYVHNHTGQRMHYSGHSLGTLMAFASLSQGQLLELLRSAALLSPVAHSNQVSSPVARFAANTFFVNLGLREFIPHGDVAGKLLEGVCHSLNYLDCSKMVSPATGTMNVIGKNIERNKI
ncbi:hypothetical protein Fmac_020555 [Flemingia macrophylla]|uniref:AB hydrolase-1 domain-containing protein n=1 Tax=Flemingia macrophylla TaxID=520843 RepID=A0ABD1LUF3_9FABA